VPPKYPGDKGYFVPVDEPADEARKRAADDVIRLVQCLADSVAVTTAEECVQRVEDSDEFSRRLDAIEAFLARCRSLGVVAAQPPYGTIKH
jgi:hypothetical protein